MRGPGKSELPSPPAERRRGAIESNADIGIRIQEFSAVIAQRGTAAAIYRQPEDLS